jgi:hypothetical protein
MLGASSPYPVSGNQMLSGILARGLSRQSVPSGRFRGRGGLGSTSTKEAEWLRQIFSASCVPMTLTPRSVAGVGAR